MFSTYYFEAYKFKREKNNGNCELLAHSCWKILELGYFIMTLLLIALEYSTWSSLNDLKIKLYSGGIVPHFTFVIVGWSSK